jgi:hypothetical protein
MPLANEAAIAATSGRAKLGRWPASSARSGATTTEKVAEAIGVHASATRTNPLVPPRRRSRCRTHLCPAGSAPSLLSSRSALVGTGGPPGAHPAAARTPPLGATSGLLGGRSADPGPDEREKHGKRASAHSLLRPRAPNQLPLSMVAVAQTLGEPAGSLLRVGSENRHRIRRERTVRHEVIARGCSGVHFHERAAALLRRLCATASMVAVAQTGVCPRRR